MFAGRNSAPYDRTVLVGVCVAVSRLKSSSLRRRVLCLAASMVLVNIHGLGWIASVLVARREAIACGRLKCFMVVVSMISEGRQ